MTTYTLIILILSCLFFSIRAHGVFSFSTLGTVGLFAYSIPSVLEITYPFHYGLSSRDTPLIPASTETGIVMIAAWTTFTVLIALPTSRPRTLQTPIPLRDETALLYALLILFAAGLLYMMVNQGPLFFLHARDEQVESGVRLIWRWIGPAGLILATNMRHWPAAGIFIAGICLHFISGDRTIIIISMMCFFVTSSDGRSALKLMLRPRVIMITFIVVAIAFIGKPIYISIKAGSLDPLYYSISPEGIDQVLKAYEPLSTYNIIDLVVRNDFYLPIHLLAEGVIGQFLIAPSLFGIDSNSFNTAFTATFADMITYGIAGNYWAQAFSTGGYIMVILFSALYATILRTCDYIYRQKSGAVKIGAALIGALFSVYIHRNSLDNCLAFVRQIVIALTLAKLLAGLLLFDSRPKGRRVAQRNFAAASRRTGSNTPHRRA
ncbi:hypothetical protein [Aquabacter cavernae]|uniref:hypothetical protein n=1 Tax=Aquabacter cavernae TaxID=2496029 RepID=UPI000F8D3C76|nr:hypothetical protein [Aquabacter cavernae]